MAKSQVHYMLLFCCLKKKKTSARVHQVLLPSAVRVPDGQWLEEKAGEHGEGGLHGAGSPALCLHRDRQQRAGDAATPPGGKGGSGGGG